MSEPRNCSPSKMDLVFSVTNTMSILQDMDDPLDESPEDGSPLRGNKRMLALLRKTPKYKERYKTTKWDCSDVRILSISPL
jgi:hypothetical protein